MFPTMGAGGRNGHAVGSRCVFSLVLGNQTIMFQVFVLGLHLCVVCFGLGFHVWCTWGDSSITWAEFDEVSF